MSRYAENSDKDDEIRRLSALGLSHADIGREVGLAKSSVTYRLKKLVDQNGAQTVQEMMNETSPSAEEMDEFRAYVLGHYDDSRPGGWDNW